MKGRISGERVAVFALKALESIIVWDRWEPLCNRFAELSRAAKGDAVWLPITIDFGIVRGTFRKPCRTQGFQG